MEKNMKKNIHICISTYNWITTVHQKPTHYKPTVFFKILLKQIKIMGQLKINGTLNLIQDRNTKVIEAIIENI